MVGSWHFTRQYNPEDSSEHGGQLIFKINIPFYGDYSWTIALKTNKALYNERSWDIPTSFVWIIIFLDRPLEYGDSGIFKLLRWMQNLHQSMWDHEILYANSSSDAGQLLSRPLLQETKNTNMAGCWRFKYIFYFMETTHEPLHLRHMKFVHWKIMDIPVSFIWIIIFFYGAFWI
jgi:hypothetical protein